ncbi:unnamed protein product [Oppiella nova]|uniref:Nuclear receptor domain-containing protein n=1 Tax=Oppiella nova TaxID=334625 RepID=A0A7R9M4R9_9ACAR|nr:unnamed protein product [Oppiella nova]CAG2170721.1 unnamed protein product [Oppiella nova]
MGDKETTKRCSVCGYKATGKNFGAVSCEPCKAFFRRNALKNTLKCHLDNNCKLDQITRRFCSKCRLNKCLAVGMRRDLILNDEEREMKRLKILENKKKKDNSFNSNDESLESLIDSSQETSLGNDISNTNNNTNNDILCEILDDNHFSADALNQQIMEIESTVSKDFIDNIVDNSFDNTINDQQIGVYNNCNEINSQSDYNVSNETIEKAVEFAVSVVPIARPLSECKTGFNVTEIYLLIEMKTCTKFLGAPMSTNIKSLDTMYDIHQSFTTKYDTSIRDQTKAVKWLSAFRNICCEDQISLLKYGCFDIIFLRSIMYFDYTDNTLKVPMRSHEKAYNGRHAKDFDSATCRGVNFIVKII